MGVINLEYQKGIKGFQPDHVLQAVEDFCFWICDRMNLVGRSGSPVENMKFKFMAERRSTTIKELATSLFEYEEETNSGVVSLFMTDNITLPTLLEALAHESVHADQWACGHLRHQLVRTSGGVLSWGFNWKGDNYLAPTCINTYNACPWESEAIRKSGLIVEEYMISL